jgi:CHASE3 domain sensor protein
MDIPNYKNLYELALNEINELKEKLKKYTAPSRYKKYYENHKEEIKEKVKEYREKTEYKKLPSPEKAKEYRKRAYEKLKLKKILENSNLDKLI